MYGLLGRRKKNQVTNTIEKQHFVMTKNKKGKKQKLQIESTNVVFKKLLLLRDLFVSYSKTGKKICYVLPGYAFNNSTSSYSVN